MKKKQQFEVIDFTEDDISLSKLRNTLHEVRKKLCPKAILVLRQTDGTDFPPFYSIESPEYHARCNAEGEYVLLKKFKD